MALKIPLAYLLIAIAASLALSSSDDHHHRVPPHNHRFAWPVWYRDRLLHTRHGHPNDERVVPGTSTVTTTRSPWTVRPQVPTTRSPHQVNPVLRHHVGQRTLEHKFSGGAVAMAKYDGTRAIAYASYHDNHRHQPREAVTQSYQLVPTTAPTYTRHHSGVAKKLSVSSYCFCQFRNNKRLELYVDECAIEKPCGQLCTNLPGSYRCHCRAGFQLQQDGQSCRRNDTDENAFEARDLESDFHDTSTKDPTSHDTENEVSDSDQDYEIILKRLTKLEKQVARNRKRDTETSEMNTKVTLAVESVNEMKRTVENVQLMQQEVYDMRSKMKQYEAEMRKIQHLMNRVAELENRLRIRCRSAMSINSESLNF
ncbi:Low-density lipoprotein receptor-related protein 1B [Ooceraea biroi]|uniref:Low-density lipoprotein receptor-related protein 1B n=1 Tax=Ooceraea biroi TaxID=2015173 RepID=A0A026X029_OOCBI|nr:Low-density lipoprotein receptor-related protein 1B [Ooceraea biroi]